MFEICMVAIAGTMLSLAVRAYRPEFSVFLSVACGLLLFFLVIRQLSEILEVVFELFSASGVRNSYFTVLLKVLAIAYLTDFTAQTCRDAGENGIAAKTELAGKILILYVSIPVFTAMLTLIQTLLNHLGVWNYL